MSEYSEISALLNVATAWKTAEYAASIGPFSYPPRQNPTNSTVASVPSTASVILRIAPSSPESSPMSTVDSPVTVVADVDRKRSFSMPTPSGPSAATGSANSAVPRPINDANDTSTNCAGFFTMLGIPIRRS